MKIRFIALIVIMAAAIAAGSATRVVAQSSGSQKAKPVQQGEVPDAKRAAPVVYGHAPAFTPPKTAWGDPDIGGDFTNSDESGIPFERPEEFAGRKLEDVSPDELATIVKKRQETAVERAPGLGEFDGATSPLHWFENYNAANSRAWLVSDPPDGKVPPLTDEAKQRAAARTDARKGRGPADSWTDRSNYDRCITRGLPGSMMPAIYGNSYSIHQGPGFVAITYEMIHEARVIPLDSRPHVNGDIREYMGDARGHWEGTTLVVETTNFTDKTPYRGSSKYLRMTERFKPVGPDTVEWSITFDDPHTWTKPWTFGMNLTRVDASQQPFEYACHEGNYGLRNILSAARAEEAAAAKNGVAVKPTTENENENEPK